MLKDNSIMFERPPEPYQGAGLGKLWLMVCENSHHIDHGDMPDVARSTPATPADVIAVLEQNPMLWAAVMAHWSMVVRRENAQLDVGDVEAILLGRSLTTRKGVAAAAQEIEELFAAREAQLRKALVAMRSYAAKARQQGEINLEHPAARERYDVFVLTDSALATPTSTAARRLLALEAAVDGIERFLEVATADPGATLGPIAANALAEARRRVDALRALDGGDGQ